VSSDTVVVVVGSINEDVELLVPRAPRPGETLTATRTSRHAGGKGANQAVAAARAGARVLMIGRIGADPAGARMLEDLRNEGVDTRAVAALPGVPTGTAYITVTADGENTIVLERGANAWLSPADVAAERHALAGAAVMLAQLEVPIDTVTAAVCAARDAGVRPVVTVAPAQEVPDELLAGLDPLLVNEHEAAILLAGGGGGRGGRGGRGGGGGGGGASGGGGGANRDVAADAEACARRLLGLGPRSVVITLGDAGAVVADGGRVWHVPAVTVDTVVDTTGAGDAFAGALASALAGGASLAEAVSAGMAAGAQAVGRAGAR
jgi:ribokinase